MSKIVWTNGCFDLLHPGHIELFKVGKSLGDKLIVGLDSDERVSEMKGDTRPINTFEDRKAILEAIKYIDLVLEFDSETELENLIQLYKPDILIDGGDWRNANGVGRQYAKRLDSLIESRGGVVPESSKGALMQAGDPIKFVSKGWGYEKWIANSPSYCGKLLFIAKGKKCSWHYHKLKDEVFYVQSGAIELSYGWNADKKLSKTITLIEGDKFHVPTGLKHQMFALKDTELFEFSTQHFDSDSNRIEREINMRYCVDIDGTICTPTVGRAYEKAEPWNDRISTINKLYDEGNHITYFTARGMGRFSDDPNASVKASALLFDLTEKQLKDWGCKYHDLILGKPHADFFIDDKGIQCDDFFNDNGSQSIGNILRK